MSIDFERERRELMESVLQGWWSAGVQGGRRYNFITEQLVDNLNRAFRLYIGSHKAEVGLERNSNVLFTVSCGDTVIMTVSNRSGIEVELLENLTTQTWLSLSKAIIYTTYNTIRFGY